MTKYVSKTLNTHLVKLEEQARLHYLIAARRRRNCDRLPAFYSDKPAAYYDGALMATYGAIETLLIGKYRGFCEIYPDDQTGRAVIGDVDGNGLRSYLFEVKPTIKQVA